MDHFNSSWVSEDIEALASRLGVVCLYEKLLSNKEATSTPQSPLHLKGPQLPDYQRAGTSPPEEQELYLRDLLLNQLLLARTVCSDSPFHSTLRRRLVILQRIFVALCDKFHFKADDAARSIRTLGEAEKPTDASNEKDVKEGSAVLVEMGVKTGLSLLFALFRQSWQLNGGALCNDVLSTACDVLKTVPPLSLSNESKIPELGKECLEKVITFLQSAASAGSSANARGQTLALEVLLRIAVMRGSLRDLLNWILLALAVADSQHESDQRPTKEHGCISVDCLQDVLCRMRSPNVSACFLYSYSISKTAEWVSLAVITRQLDSLGFHVRK